MVNGRRQELGMRVRRDDIIGLRYDIGLRHTVLVFA